MTHLTEKLRELYEGDSDRAHRFRYLLLVFDLTTLLFIVLSSFMPQQPLVEGLDVVIGVAVAADFASRLAISPRRWREFLRPTTWADVAAIASFLAPLGRRGDGRGLPAHPAHAAPAADLSAARPSAGRLPGLPPQRGGDHRAGQPRGVHLRDDRHRLRDAAPDEPSHRQLRRRALLHGDIADHDGLRRHHSAGHGRAADLCRGDDLRRDPVPAPRPGFVPALQGALPLPDLRPAAARAGRRSLQGLRHRAEHPR
ncbi:Iron transport domain protein, N-terminal (plasmid) [Methylorubrum extorquens AM1]|uniref:Iron transport domain protein, N-terminal n=1 Tax=Methylorubrum extorquens (strain ATCC 14718 / DSM 1338 / JCM 2805 / NCIMB 9133 / AM1) TaxID=272630 RepID=C5B624_METEA|nr:Iron transport domain protein, N-terminal [Methylorubrum extorquens AM1]